MAAGRPSAASSKTDCVASRIRDTIPIERKKRIVPMIGTIHFVISIYHEQKLGLIRPIHPL